MDQPDNLLDPSLRVSPTGRTGGGFEHFREWLRNNHRAKNLATLGILVFFILVIAGVRMFLGAGSFFTPKTNYVPVYTLVNDKISQHGAIVVNLPKGTGKDNVESKVIFDPVIKGEWTSSSLKDAIVFKPSAELVLGKHYLVALATEGGIIKKDFLVDEDPAVISVFPDATAEADPASAITIVFNRPMVPLTTLTELDSKNIPVTVSPVTPGKFKWISTRTLQFIPEKTLFGSAHYTVSINSGFVSVDGLSVPGKTYSFITKQLRLNHVTSNSVVYNQPLSFNFNQSIDLDKTSREVVLTNNATHAQIEFVASYGKKTVWDSSNNTNKEIEDRSTLDILPKNALNGHSNIWDFSTSYTASIKTAFAIGGDIPLSGTFNGFAAMTTVTSSPVLKNVDVKSEKTDLASVQLFDPAGSVTFSFYEDIDTSKSVIHAKGLNKIEYGKKCQTTSDDNNYSDNCVKVDDKSQLILTFDSKAYSRGEQVPVVFERLINSGGFQVNKEPLTTTLAVYPVLQILKTGPMDGGDNASISNLIICTNVPLKPYEAADFYKNFHANKYMVFGRWGNPYLEGPTSYQNPPPCAPGQYVNNISYGVLPLQTYNLNFSVEDAFGQKGASKISFSTTKAPKFYLKLQNLQKIYNVTTPEHTKLTYATENFDYVNMFICKVSPGAMVKYLALQPNDVSTTPNSAFDCLTSISKKIPMKSDQWINQYFQIDVKDYFEDPRGQYVLSFSHPDFKDSEGNTVYAHTYLSVTNLAVTDNRVKWTSYDYLADVPKLSPSDTRGSVFWLSNMHSLEPEVGAKISLFNTPDINKGGSLVSLADTNTTNEKGFAEFPLVADVVGAAVTSGDESAVVSKWADTLSLGSWSDAYQEEKVYLYTDRPIYRPGQQVFLKGIYRLNFDGMFKVFQDNDILIQVSDSRGKTILTQKVPVSAYGTFSANVTLPADAALGTYSISARNGYARFDVEEYVGAAFEAKAEADKDEYTAGDSAKLSVSGKYYFGVPLDGGTLNYSITSQNFYFDRYTDEYFNFGSGWYNCYDCGYGDSYLKSGKITLDTQGTAQIALPLDFTTLFKAADRDQSKIFVFHGTIKDKQGKSVSFQKSFIVHRGDYYLGVKADPSFVGAKQSFKLRIKTVNVQGKAISKSGMTVTINKVGWESNKRQEVDGGFYNRPQRTLTPVLTKNISTSYSGDYSQEVMLSDAGDYEIDAVGKDSSGNDIKSSSEVYVYGQGNIEVEPTNNATLNITAEQTDVKVGDTAKFIIQNPYPHAKALITILRGRIFSYEVVDINQSMYEYQFPVTEEYTPNVYASVVLLSPLPAVKFAQIQFTVDKQKKQLTIDVQPNKSSYLPGEKVGLTVHTTDALGNPAPASVSIAVADVSVLALKGNPKKDPLVFFYGGFPLTVTAETNIKNLLEETPIPTGTKGGDGGSPADLATRKRGEFKDTAFWQADVITNEQGVAQVSFTLPDNLTKWQLESVGVTKDTKLGVQYKEIVTQKNVMLVPLVPRFVVPGDEFMIGAKIFNQTQSTQSLSVSLESTTLNIEDSAQTQETIKAGDTDTVYFKVKAPQDKIDGAHIFTLSAKNDAYNDTVEQRLPITRNMTYESTATAGSTSASSTSEYLYLPDNVVTDHGGLTIKTSATLAVYLSDAITYLFAYPYGCGEQLASKLSAIAIAKQVATLSPGGTKPTLPTITFNNTEYTVDQAVTIGLNQIYDNQVVTGGFSYYKGLQPDPYLSMQILNTFLDLKSAGYSVRQEVIDQTVQYLRGQVGYFRSHSDTDTLILLAYTLSRVGGEIPFDVASLVTTSYLNDKVSSNTLGYLALLAVNRGVSADLKEKIFATLINRVDIDSRGAYVKTNNNNFGWAYYETPEKDTALFLKALVLDKRDYAETDNIIRWLVASRKSDGSWGSTNTSVAALDALTSYVGWKREAESNFTLETLLDGKNISSTSFGKDNIFSTIEKFLPVASIELNKTHTLTFGKTNNNSLLNKFYYDLSLKYYLPVDQIGPRDEGIAITRDFYSLTDTKNTLPLTRAKVGDVVRGVLTIISPKQRHLLSLEDYIPAGFELVNFNLATEDQATETDGAVGYNATPAEKSDSSVAIVSTETATRSQEKPFVNAHNLLASLIGVFGVDSASTDTGSDQEIVYQKFYPDFSELRDDRLFLFAQNVQSGTYKYEYYLRATTPGTFSHLPAVASEMYFPENFGRTPGSVFTVLQ